jgi:uncharacterized membrane-anchored protein YjiN (DUF445 family)
LVRGHALFHEIPIPFVRKQTLSPKQRKLTEGIVDLVTNKWLSPDIIAEKLNEVDLAKPFWISSSNPNINKSGIRLIQNIVLKFANELDNPKFADACKKILKSRLP